ncbi:carboxylesterase [Rhizodiscina lignyota]|uniref:Carboxylesterase n=1 Tax=Rhizodiscina lignyota TaxID=1504668 RepID=A0A9P4I6N7_9PEZI|nr:carboxylesterase [Rhizodiscina lignyota]
MAPLTIETPHVAAEVLEQRNSLLDKFEKGSSQQPQVLRDADAAAYRKMRAEGTNGFVPPRFLPEAENITIRTRDEQEMKLRIVRPTSGKSHGCFLHFHAGSLVFGSAAGQDFYLARLANDLGLTAVSVDYRLAPEYPFPKSQEDSVDAALFALSSAGIEKLGGPLRLLVGESAGAYLAVRVALSLRDHHNVPVAHKLAGLICSYGTYDLSYTPSLLSHTRNIIVNRENLQLCTEAAFPKLSTMDRRDAKYSPLYADLRNMPPALFLCGTEDPFIDDNVFMASKWSLVGNHAELKLIPGAGHAFTLIPAGEVQNAGLSEIVKFAKALLLL